WLECEVARNYQTGPTARGAIGCPLRSQDCLRRRGVWRKPGRGAKIWGRGLSQRITLRLGTWGGGFFIFAQGEREPGLAGQHGCDDESPTDHSVGRAAQAAGDILSARLRH